MEESGSGQKFCLKWNQYSSNLAASLAGMRESGAMTDVTLVTEDGARFLAHRVVLAAASNFFSGHPWIYLKGVPGYQMRLMLDFLYLGEVEVPESELAQFLSTAGELKVRGLTKYAGGLGNMAELKSSDSGHLHQIVTENEDVTEIEETGHEAAGNDMAGEEHQYVAENFIEVNAELDQKIEDILVKNNGVWTCRVCGKFANHKSKLKQHVETHIDGFSHPCGICGKSYRSRNVLRMHLSRDHRNKKSQV